MPEPTTPAETARAEPVWRPTTDTMIEIGTAVLAGLRDYRHLPAIIGFNIGLESKASISLCAGGPYTLAAMRNIAVWAQALDLGLTVTRGPLSELFTEDVKIGGHPVRFRVHLFDSRRDELVTLLTATCQDMPVVPHDWRQLHPTPAQVLAAMAGHPDLPKLAP